MALTPDQIRNILKDFQTQRDDLVAKKFNHKIGLDDIDFLNLMDEFEDKVVMVANSELFSLDPDRLPFLMIFPPPDNEATIKERLHKLGFSDVLNQIQIRLSKIEDLDDQGKDPYIIFDTDPGHLLKEPRYSSMFFKRMQPPRRCLTFFEAVTMAPKINANFQIVVTGSRYVDVDTAPAIDFVVSRAAPILNYFDLNSAYSKIGIPSCTVAEVYKSNGH